MNTKMNTVLGAVLVLLVLTLTTNAATQVYDLKTDWSDTQNPNGTWSFRAEGGDLLPNYSFPWGYLFWGDWYSGEGEGLRRITGDLVVPGYLEAGDVSVLLTSGVNVRWTAPANGTISVSGNIWGGGSNEGYTGGMVSWTLRHNVSPLSTGAVLSGALRSAPHWLSSGSGGAAALQNVSVQTGDLIEISYIPQGGGPSGVNFTITLTTDSVDPVTAIEDLAIMVFKMNLQNGIENSLDSKLDAAINALIDANFNNDGAACNSLAAFISAVEAQRGNKITSAQADQLIAAAQQIKAVLNCGN